MALIRAPGCVPAGAKRGAWDWAEGRACAGGTPHTKRDGLQAGPVVSGQVAHQQGVSGAARRQRSTQCARGVGTRDCCWAVGGCRATPRACSVLSQFWSLAQLTRSLTRRCRAVHSRQTSHRITTDTRSEGHKTVQKSRQLVANRGRGRGLASAASLSQRPERASTPVVLPTLPVLVRTRNPPPCRCTRQTLEGGEGGRQGGGGGGGAQGRGVGWQ